MMNLRNEICVALARCSGGVLAIEWEYRSLRWERQRCYAALNPGGN